MKKIDKASGVENQIGVTVTHDECNRPDTTLEDLAALCPVHAGGQKIAEGKFVTAGNASQFADGASACVVMSEETAAKKGIKPLGIFKGFAVAGGESDEMGIGPVLAVPKLLARHGLKVGDIDLWELNEAFASQTLYCMDKLGLDPAKTNVNGGAISIGHPYGMTGARLTSHVLLEGGAARRQIWRGHHVHRRRHGRGRPVRDIVRLTMLRPTLFLLAALILAACVEIPQGRPLPPDPKTQMGALEARIAMLVEEQRHRLDPKARNLAIDPELSKIARARAADMAAKNYLAHAAPNGDTSASLLMKQDERWQGLLGENLAAQHYTKLSGVTVNDFAQRFLEEWIKSPPHRDNMAFANYDHAGVGAAVNGDTVYVALLFSTDMGLTPRPPEAPANAVTAFESPAAATAPPAPADPMRLRGRVGAQSNALSGR